ncbi:hypothetical protein, partial [Thermodesulfovibrio sp.]|uniref:hypothetical protein n=1 Tax=Thermodesulfovibrio sp. TaxID=2067987 RepID=UPI0030A13E7F
SSREMLHEALQIGRLKSVLKNGVQYKYISQKEKLRNFFSDLEILEKMWDEDYKKRKSKEKDNNITSYKKPEDSE